jgi:tRNA-intron endonuclease
MSQSKKSTSEGSELRTKGLLQDKGVRISAKEGVDALSSRGYGVAENGVLLLAFYESLYLLDKGMLEVEDEKGEKVGFQSLLQFYGKVDENAWAKYLVYRDLRSRGYVVREGFGSNVDFRLYERGAYSKDAATYLIMSTQEGKPICLEDLANALMQCHSLKKELVLAVMNRRGEIVYYSVSQLTFK